MRCFILVAIGIIWVGAYCAELRWRNQLKKQRSESESRLRHTESAINEGARGTPYRMKE